MIGEKHWIIPDMYWPEVTSSDHYVSHEAVCVLNISDSDCSVCITLYYEDREPIMVSPQVCKAHRTKHIRMDQVLDAKGKSIPRGIPYAATVACSVSTFVQYTRVDTTDPHVALMTTMAHPVVQIE